PICPAAGLRARRPARSGKRTRSYGPGATWPGWPRAWTAAARPPPTAARPAPPCGHGPRRSGRRGRRSCPDATGATSWRRGWGGAPRRRAPATPGSDHVGLAERLRLVLRRPHRDAAAEHVLVAVHVVHARHRRPVLLLAQRGQREDRQFARVGARPLAGRGLRRGVRRALERVVLAVHASVLDRADLLADLDHGVDEAV